MNLQQKLITPELSRILSRIHNEFEQERRMLLRQRAIRQLDYDKGEIPRFVERHPANTEKWKVAPIPDDLQERRVEITGPVNNPKMVINMLSKGPAGICADMAMLDFEDSMMPAWGNVLQGIENVIGAARGDLQYVQPSSSSRPEKVYKLDPENMAHPLVRIRGLHLNESNITVGGTAISAGLFDLTACAFHAARLFLENGRTPMFYVPKCEHYLEARWWNKLFEAVERNIDLPSGTIKTTLLIETLPATYQMEEILYEMRDRIVGLNGGRWDKIFSDIKVLKNHKHRVSANRSAIDMKCQWMDNYAKRLIKICHRRGAFAMGGMSAFTPGKDEETRSAQLKKVMMDKAHEAEIGHDGCWVSHPFFIEAARNQFSKKNQLDVMLTDFPDKPELLMQATGPRDLNGLRTNVRVGIAYMEGWSRELGCIAFDDLMEDLATLEISRAQVWQWLNHEVVLDSGEEVTSELVERVFEEETDRIVEEVRQALSPELFELRQRQYREASREAQNLFLKPHLDDFLSTASPLENAIEITTLTENRSLQL
ncbi:MAG: malate synthase A [Bdellovibrionales bacterium]|nr:malate synthase A [Bdellovibrionales bacterium]